MGLGGRGHRCGKNKTSWKKKKMGEGRGSWRREAPAKGTIGSARRVRGWWSVGLEKGDGRRRKEKASAVCCVLALPKFSALSHALPCHGPAGPSKVVQTQAPKHGPGSRLGLHCAIFRATYRYC